MDVTHAVVVLDQEIVEDGTWRMHAKLCRWLGVGITVYIIIFLNISSPDPL